MFSVCNNWIREPKFNGPSPFQSVDCHVRMADPPEAAPVVEQPSTQAEVPMEEVGEVAAAGGGWGSWGLLEQGLAGVAS